jgi:general secretion pathway protein I
MHGIDPPNVLWRASRRMSSRRAFAQNVLVPLGRERGFTLIEVLVAFAIAGLLLVPLLRIFSGGMAELTRGERSATAVLWGQTILESVAGDALLAGSAGGGLPDGYSWQRTVALYTDDRMTPSVRPLVPYSVSVTILWRDHDRERSVRLDTLRLGPPPPPALPP